MVLVIYYDNYQCNEPIYVAGQQQIMGKATININLLSQPLGQGAYTDNWDYYQCRETIKDK